MVMSLDTLPRDVLTKILLELPAKSLLACKAVCKEFHDVISTPTFIQDHFDHDNNQISRLLLCFDGCVFYSVCPYYHLVWYWQAGFGRSTSYSYFPDESSHTAPPPNHLMLFGEIIYLRGPCSGIFCIYIADNRFVLWNPTTRRVRLIRCSPLHQFDEMGFGMDPVTGEFKIVLIYSDRTCTSPCFAVYTASNDSWKYMQDHESLADFKAYMVTYLCGSNTFLNGFYYWIKHPSLISINSILAFDMRNETFQEINIPDMVGAGVRKSSQLHVFNDSLAIVSFTEFDPFRMEIWVMKGPDQQWTKFLSTAAIPSPGAISYGFWGRNKILVASILESPRTLMAYDIDSDCTIPMYRRPPVGSHFSPLEVLPIHYRESLMPVKGQGIRDYDAQSPESLEFFGYHIDGPATKINRFQFMRTKLIG